ncbi:uncharacterized protein LOC125942701 [Dermacentor silvarum]|uniref:uncharacterized protein LOC125942701 n=1 Tax=Dermacentor silvarum TaxID=543639 RepID=UPI0021019182|nr:uncharacterized protein LOC125942701 [Dermacentor silvarum]
MHKAKIHFSGGERITFGGDEEDEVPLTQPEACGSLWSDQASGSQSEVAFQGGRQPAWTKSKTQPRGSGSRSTVQRRGEGRSFSRLHRRSRNSRATGANRHHWPTLWFVQLTAVVITIVVGALVALTYILREASLTAKVVHDAGSAMDVDDLANSTNITATLLGDRFDAADLDNSSLEASAAVVSGFGSSFTASSEPTTPEGVIPSLRERPGERPSQKHHSKTVRGAGPKEEQRVRGSSLQPENEGKGLHREGEASQVHSIEHAAEKTTG